MELLIKKTVGNLDCSAVNAFSADDTVRFTLTIPRSMEMVEPRLIYAPDGKGDVTLYPVYDGYADGADLFSIELSMRQLCEDGDSGLFYYEFRFEQNYKYLYTSSVNNRDFTISDRSGRRFALLVYSPDFHTPTCFYGTTMYHIFVDRFAKGKKKIPCRSDALINEDWEHGIPEFAPYPGAPLKNNVFFGGNLDGIIEKLDYLQSLSVDCIYLSPIFKAYSNHKYDTGDYTKIDEMFGGEAAFGRLLDACRRRSIRVILDGVFNHTGDDSLYFNRYGKYDSVGAYQSQQSPYADWYHFTRFPDQYEAWWGIEILPRLNASDPDCRDYFVGKDGVCPAYIRAGASGWRLDVADELSDDFLDRLRKVVKAENENALIIGEVWENAAEKVAYGARRRYFRGRQLDSVMNYPTKNAIVSFMQTGDCTLLYNTVTEIYATYPRCVCDVLMNILGTHDTERILTVLGGVSAEGRSNAELSTMKMDEGRRAEAIALLKLASVLQYTLYGFPSVFYGDEAGLEGYRDPFCRMPYPWGRADEDLRAHYAFLGKLRADHSAFCGGDFEVAAHDCGLFAFTRADENEKLLIIISRVSFPIEYTVDGRYRDLKSGKTCEQSVTVYPNDYKILKLL